MDQRKNTENGFNENGFNTVEELSLIHILLVVLMPYAGMIPMPTIAAILFIVAYNMCQWRTFKHLVEAAPRFWMVTWHILVVWPLSSP